MTRFDVQGLPGPNLEDAALADFEPASAAMFPLPISWLEPRDISAAVVFLASDDARYITGQQLRVDGGVALERTPGLPEFLNPLTGRAISLK